MLKKILIVIIFLIAAIRADAQVTSGTITAASSGVNDCNSTNCVELSVSRASNIITFTIVHSGTSTSIFEFSTNNRLNWNTLTATNLVSYATATGVSATSVFGHVNLNYTHVRVRNNNSFSSGSQQVTINASANSSMTSLAFGGGSGGTIGTVNQGTASVSENWRVACIVGCGNGTQDTDDGSVATGQSTGISVGMNYIYNGATWGRLTFGQAAMANSLPVTIANNQTALPVTGTFFQATQPISAVTLPLPTGAATEATLANTNTSANFNAAFGTAGTPDTQVLSVQGIASSTPLRTTPTDTVGDPAVDNTANAIKVLNVDSAGTAISPGVACTDVAIIDTAANGLTQLVALTAGQTIYVCSFVLTAEATVDARLVTGTGTACATGTTPITGNFAFSTTTGMLGVANGSGLGMVTKGLVANALCVQTSAGVQVNGQVSYAKF